MMMTMIQRTITKFTRDQQTNATAATTTTMTAATTITRRRPELNAQQLLTGDISQPSEMTNKIAKETTVKAIPIGDGTTVDR